MSVSYINEYCQQNCLQTPTYQFAGDGQNGWFCKTNVGNYQGLSGKFSIKQSAKEDAAEKVAIQLRQQYDQSHRSFNQQNTVFPSIRDTQIVNTIKFYPVIYIIDLENRPFYNEYLSDNTLYLGFISVTHHSRSKYQWKTPTSDDLFKESKEYNALLFEIGGGVKELADHYMSAMAYSIINYISHIGQHVKVVIKSCDNAGWCTNICLKQIAEFRDISQLLTIENSA